jgi:outer membrane protein
MSKPKSFPYQPYTYPLGWFILFFLLLGYTTATAQDRPSGGTWSLDECVKYALKNNITIQQNELQVQSVGNDLTQSKYSRYPTVNSSASQAISWGLSINPVTNDAVNQRINSNNFSVNASMNLFSGFETKNTIRRNETNYQVNQLNLEQSRQTTSLNVALGYLNILLNKELLAVAQKNVESTNAQLERTQKLYDAGAIAENDVINLKATLANNELNVTSAKNNLLTAKVSLQQTMNLAADENFEVKAVDVDAFRVEDFAETSAQIYSTAESSQPNIKSADLNIKSNELAVEIARSDRYPTLTLNGSLYTNYSKISNISSDLQSPFGEQLGDNFGQQLSLNLRVPIFNAWQIKRSIANSVINKRNSELIAKDSRNQLRQTIEQSWVNAKNALQTYQAREEQVKSLELAFQTTEKRYNAGASNVVDFNLAKINLDNAKSDLVRAKYDYLFRKKVLDFYMNKPLSIE